MKVAILFSGGKDSCFAIWHVLHQGWEIASLVSIQSMNPNSYMFHYPNIQWTRLQAEALGFPIIIHESKGEKEGELKDLEKSLSDLKKTSEIDGVITGAIASEYQKTRIDRLCYNLELASFSPLWKKDPEFLIKQQVELGFEIIISACMARGLTPQWLGRRIDGKCLDELKELKKRFGINMAFEGGEAETFVIDGPIFRNRIMIEDYRKIWCGDSGYLKIIDAKINTE